MQQMPSVVELAVAFRQMKNGRAAGISGLPPEAFSHAALEAAHAYYPVLMKMIVGGRAPQAWRHAWVIPTPKPSKGPGKLESWRSIALLETGMKGIAKAVRTKLMCYIEPMFQGGQGGSKRGATLDFPLTLTKSHVRKLWQSSTCGAVIYIDGASAFYAVLREYLLDDSCNMNDQQRLVKVVELLHPSESVRQEILATLLGPSVLQDAGAPHILRRFVATTLNGTYFTMDPVGDEVWATRTGVTPGAPLADAYFQGIFVRCLQELEGNLRAMHGKQNQVHIHGQPACQSVPAPVATWIDDAAILAEVSEPKQLVAHVREIVAHAQAALAHVGIRTNFCAGKTEVMLVFVGKRSRKEKIKWLAQEKPHIPVELACGSVVDVVVTSEYQHVGSLVQHTGEDIADVERRRLLGRQAFAPLYKRLLFNLHLTLDEKRLVVQSMVGRKFMHGSGQWALRTRKELRAYHTGYMYHWRKCGRPLLGVTFAGATDVEICDMLGVLRPLEALAVERLRTLIHVLRSDHGYLEHVLREDTWWLPKVCRDVQVIAESAEVVVGLKTFDPGSVMCAVKEKPAIFQRAIRIFQQKVMKSRKELAAIAMNRVSWRMRALHHGISVSKLKACARKPSWPCPECGRMFVGAAAVGVHRARAHGYRALACGIVGGTVCQVCLMDFQTTHRLRLHIQRSCKCRTTLVESDVAMDGPQIGCPQRAWQPAVKVQGPKDFWATLCPTQSSGANPGTVADATCLMALVKLAEDCPKQDNTRAMGSFIAKCFKVLDSLAFSKGIGADELAAFSQDLASSTPNLPEILDVIGCFGVFDDSLEGEFEGNRWKFKWQGQMMLVGHLNADLREEYFCV